MMYRIIWQHRITGGRGESDILYTSQKQAITLALRADRAVPEISHTVRGE